MSFYEVFKELNKIEYRIVVLQIELTSLDERKKEIWDKIYEDLEKARKEVAKGCPE
jgi:predicted transcriptional regulator